jgi:hypothetical protein
LRSLRHHVAGVSAHSKPHPQECGVPSSGWATQRQRCTPSMLSAARGLTALATATEPAARRRVTLPATATFAACLPYSRTQSVQGRCGCAGKVAGQSVRLGRHGDVRPGGAHLAALA